MSAFTHRFEPSEIKSVEKSLKALEKLAELRNEIAHGHVSNYTIQEGDQVLASGNYLLPSLNEKGPHERDFRFHHTLETIAQFVADVRTWRGDIVDVGAKVLMRDNEQEFSPEYNGYGYMLGWIAQKIARRELGGKEAILQLSDLLKRISDEPLVAPPVELGPAAD